MGDYQDEDDSFTDSQLISLAILPKIAGSLSILCSFSIVYEILRDKIKRTKTYHRLLLATSICDINVSFWFAMSTWPIPKGTDDVKFAVGNTQTCTLQGFMIQLGISAILYNCGLALFYLLQIRYNWRDAKFHTRIFSENRFWSWVSVERLLHIIPLVFAIGTSVTGLVLKLYNNANMWCWIAPLPQSCDGRGSSQHSWTSCERGNHAWIYQLVFFYLPLWLAVACSIVCMVLMYRSVVKTEEATKKWIPSKRFKQRPQSAQPSSLLPTQPYRTTTPPTTTITTIPMTRNTSTTLLTTQESNMTDTTRNNLNTSSNILLLEIGEEDIEEGNDQEQRVTETESPVLTTTQVYNDYIHDDSPQEDDEDEEEAKEIVNATTKSAMGAKILAKSSIDTIRQLRRKRKSKKYHEQSRRVFYQALFYIVSFYLAWGAGTIHRFVQFYKQETTFALAIWHAISSPLQGFFNYCVYLRPRILEYRKVYINKHPKNTQELNNSCADENSTNANTAKVSEWQIIKWAIAKSYGYEPPLS